MTNQKKFSILVTLFIISSVFLNINAINYSDKMKVITENYEESYTASACDGNNNIIKAGCSVIAGQAVRGIPAMAFGASFDEIQECVQKMEKRSGTSVTINADDTCNQFGLYNPTLDTSNFVLERNGPSNSYSILGTTNLLFKLNQEIENNSFDSTYYAYKAIENIPVAKDAFAQSKENMWGLGNFYRDTSYNMWVTVRNISYGLIGLLSIILGLTLMSSNSIFDSNAKWRLSLEQAIPRVIIAVILIQFSYFIGESLLYIANESNFEPIFRYIANIPGGGGWANLGAGLTALAPTALLGGVLALTVSIPGVGQFLLIGLLVFGLWYLYRLLVLWFYNFTLVLEVVLFTIASPLIISMSLLPGEAGAQQTRRYFSTFLSLLGRTFLLKIISVGPTLMLALLLNWMYSGDILTDILAVVVSPVTFLAPLILSIIIL